MMLPTRGRPRPTEGVDTEYGDSGSPDIGWTGAGEWIKYAIKVDEPGIYNVNVRTASLSGGGILSVLFNSDTLISKFAIPTTGAWTTFKATNLGNVTLDPSDTIMEYYIGASGFNIGMVTITGAVNIVPTRQNSSKLFEVFPNPVNNFINIKLLKSQTASISIYNSVGIRVADLKITAENYSYNLSNLSPGMYLMKLISGSDSGYSTFIKQ